MTRTILTGKAVFDRGGFLFRPRFLFEGHQIKMKRLTALFMLATSALLAETITTDSPRPLSDAIGQIAKLSGLAINYEDVRVLNAADIQNVTGTLGPRGGKLSAHIMVDPTTQTLPDVMSAQNALSAVVTAYNTSGLPGKFKIDTGNMSGVFYVAPMQERNAIGQNMAFAPVLSSRITLPAVKQIAYVTLQAILNEVSKASGQKVGMGMIPMQAFAATEVTIGAENEPANNVLARLFEAVSTAGADPNNVIPAMSYRMLYVPQWGYGFNILVFPNPNIKQPLPVQTTTPPPVDDGRFNSKP